jgi:hypothetical protein
MADAHQLEAQLRALKESHDRVIERLWAMVAWAEKRAAEGDALAAYLLEELEGAHDGMVSENIAASAVLAEAGG